MIPDDETIKVMDSVLANQVAAGEVVERPASVIKELVENSIDAGARIIRVDIMNGGVSSIRVSDDGCGMSRHDAQMSIVRHATSKIRQFEDLFDIRQMGFRGEALPSIASVSKLKITTRRETDVEGTLVLVEAGDPQPTQHVGCARGTAIEVRDLFFNTPARRKFLKSAETETAHIDHQIGLHALCHPHIRFVLTADQRLVIDTPATKDLRMRIADLMGRDLASKLIEITPAEAPGVRVSGYLMPMSEAKRGRRRQFFFLNNRPIDDKIISRAIRDGYGGLPTGLNPPIFLYLEVEPALVDINVHPAKREVRFRRMSDICTAIIDAIRDSLSAHARHGSMSHQPERTPSFTPTQSPFSSLPKTHSLPPSPAAPLAASPPQPAPLALKPIATHLTNHQKELSLPSNTSQHELPPPDHRVSPKTPSTHESLAPPSHYVNLMAPHLGNAPHFQHIGNLHQELILFENEDGLVIMSPRATRERLIFERLMQQSRRFIPSQQLLIPVMIEMDARDIALLDEMKPQLERAGFAVEIFGHRTLRVESIPSLIKIDDLEPFITQLLGWMSAQGEHKLKRSRNPYELFAMELAHQCAMQEDISSVLDSPCEALNDLLCCEIPYCTPTGKPTIIPFSMNDLGRKFNYQ